MNILKILLTKKQFDEYVYRHTTKPKHYIHVDKPKSLQDHRQVQYNNWCKRNGVYNGSYLPADPDVLLKRGWKESRGKFDRSIRNFCRKSTGQEIQFNEEKIIYGMVEDKHYHWINRDCKGKQIKGKERFDRYGNPCRKHSTESHLLPYDKEYKQKRRG